MSEKRSGRIFSEYMPLPMCKLDTRGKVLNASPGIDQVFLYDGIKGADIFALTGIKHEQFTEAAKNKKTLTIYRNEKTFRIVPAFVGKKEPAGIALYFMDVTDFEQAEKKYEEEKLCVIVVNVDNFDELLSGTGDDAQASLASEIDKTIRQWGSSMKASVTKYRDNMYIIMLQNKYLEEQIEKKFPILDQVREIETEVDFPVTLSIGCGKDCGSPTEAEDFAVEARDLALGRGGDQAIVKEGDKFYYYGGKTQTVEKSNKGKSRIIGHALTRLIENAENVLIMGHKNPDMDAFGAALGIYRLARPINKETYIIVNKYNEALAPIYKMVKETGDYSIITSRKALNIAKKETLVIIVDTHRAGITDCPEILEIAEKSAVIDHHRKAEDFIKNPTLVYIEPYASSTAELVTEILQYSRDKKSIVKIEAEALLAGISVDTNRFAVKTGVRTFEAAAWLRKSGADTTTVKRLFQTNLETFKTRANCMANADFLEEGIAISICEGRNVNAQIINSQVADELLTIKGIKASFVAGRNEEGRTVLSARSLGDINVQTIMEEFDGGGHLTTAGAQMDMEPREAIEKVKEILKKEKTE
jgi:c-di-AMP phosphodiesterase-like protein